jgi:hypothetical protein
MLNELDTKPQRILVLYWYSTEMRPAIKHHLETLNFSEINHKITYYNTFYGFPKWLFDLGFDVIILHTTLLCMRWSHLFYIWKWELRWLGNVNCLKIAIPQDEYDHSEILDEWLYEWKVTVIFTNFDEHYRKTLYPIMHNKATFYKCFTGYINNSIAQEFSGKIINLEHREYDIVYRASHLPYWFGSQGQLKHQIADIVSQKALEKGLKCNISTDFKDTITGNHWFDFLGSGKAVIGCESGSSVLDRRGEVKSQIQHLLKNNPNISFPEISKYLPCGWDDYKFFAISPRHFEAIFTKTCQILIEGQYDQILEPNRHFLLLKRDFSNLNEVLEKIQDNNLLYQITECAYNEIYLSGKYSYSQFARKIDKVIYEDKNDKKETKYTFYLSARLTNKIINFYQAFYRNSYLKFPILFVKIKAILDAMANTLKNNILRLLKIKAILDVMAYALKNNIFRLLKIKAILDVMANKGLREILLIYVIENGFKKSSELFQLLKELLRLKIIMDLSVNPTFIDDKKQVQIKAEEKGNEWILISRFINKSDENWENLELENQKRLKEFSRLVKKGTIEQIIWDHTAMVNSIYYPIFKNQKIFIQLDIKGLYEFKGISKLCKDYPEEMSNAILMLYYVY